MEATRILPDLQCTLPCEDIRREANGNVILIGIFTLIPLPKFPFVAPKLCVFNRWTNGLGNWTESVRFLAPDRETVLGEVSTQFELKTPEANATTGALFGNVRLETPGTYWFEISVDDVLKLRYPLIVMEVRSDQE